MQAVVVLVFAISIFAFAFSAVIPPDVVVIVFKKGKIEGEE